jgi:hypothetical protein
MLALLPLRWHGSRDMARYPPRDMARYPPLEMVQCRHHAREHSLTGAIVKGFTVVASLSQVPLPGLLRRRVRLRPRLPPPPPPPPPPFKVRPQLQPPPPSQLSPLQPPPSPSPLSLPQQRKCAVSASFGWHQATDVRRARPTPINLPSRTLAWAASRMAIAQPTSLSQRMALPWPT